MADLRRAAVWTLAVGIVAVLALLAWDWTKRHPQDVPWGPLDLRQPVGAFTGRKLAALRGDFGQCRTLLNDAGVHYTALPPLRPREPQCGYTDGVRFTGGGSRRVGYFPASLGVSCPVAAALTIWEWRVVQPAARARFGQPVATIEHFGSYNCRRIAGRDAAFWSEHATANAVDIAAFVLTDGTRITVVGNWQDKDRKAAFLRDVHAGACDLFGTVLGPAYNAAHRDHFHLDQAERAMGWRVCR